MLMGMVSRLVPQKGFDLLEAIMEEVLSRDVQFVLLGTGDPRYERFFRDIAERHRERARVVIGFDDALAHRIEAGADVFLMPSAYEPCGLNQMYSLKYATIPIVHATGGLRDTVGPQNGFVFDRYEPAALLDAIDRAHAAFCKRSKWSRLMRAAMRCDHSWDRSAAAYVSVYRRLLQN
jgi:starch synthase